jgi:hypothetical protein
MLDALARSIGEAASAFKRWIGMRAAATRRAGRPAQALGRLLVAKRRLALEIARLEAELERLHARIARPALSLAGDGEPRGAELERLIARARSLRDALQERRERLLRLERHVARERWLASQETGARTEGSAGRRGARSRANGRAPAGVVREVIRRIPIQKSRERTEIEQLGRELQSRDPELRRRACVRLGELRHPAAHKLLIAAARDRNERVRLAALAGLSGERAPAVIAAFRESLRSSSPGVRLAALRALSSADARLLEGGDLARALEDEEPSVRRAAATLAGWREQLVHDPDVFLALGAALRDAEVPVRLAAVEALGSLAAGRVVLSLIRATADPEPQVADAALRALRDRIGDELDGIGAGLEPGERALALKRWWNGARIDFALGKIGATPARSEAKPAASGHVEPAVPRAPASEPARSPSVPPSSLSRPTAALAEMAKSLPDPVAPAERELSEVPQEPAIAAVASPVPEPAELAELEAKRPATFPEAGIAAAEDSVEPAALADGAGEFADLFGQVDAEQDAAAGPDAATPPADGDEDYVDLFGSENE